MHQIKYWLFVCLTLFTIPQIVVAEPTDNQDKPVGSINEKVKDLVHAWAAYYAKVRLEIKLWLDNPSGFAPGKSQNAPPGSPIGG